MFEGDRGPVLGEERKTVEKMEDQTRELAFMKLAKGLDFYAWVLSRGVGGGVEGTWFCQGRLLGLTDPRSLLMSRHRGEADPSDTYLN